jgi:hypothetical protein
MPQETLPLHRWLFLKDFHAGREFDPILPPIGRSFAAPFVAVIR